MALAFVRPADAQKQPSRSPHGPLNIPCENCHTSTSWAPIRAVPEFNHDSTRYPLRGMHEKVRCTECHTKPVFSNVGKNCADCHADIHRGQMGANCAECHTPLGWNVSTQSIKNHFNRFPLLGAHAVVQCDLCHKNAAAGQFAGLSTACASCHLTDFQKTVNPNHVAAKFSTTCETCHTTFDTWLNASFDHAITGFLLTNGHANVPCASCHVNNNYNLTIAPTDCGNSQCHLTTWQTTTNPVHPSAGAAFAAANCTTCHNTVSWTTATFDHSTTGFLLTNGHANVACASCHVNNNYTLTIAPTDCGNSQCHLTTWQQTNNPVHSTSGTAFAAANCATCHTTVSWTTAAFDHSATGFALTGTHMSPTPTACVACHVSNNYTLSSTDCYGCHSAAFQSTATLGGTVPNHVTAGFPTAAAQCASCHPITTWAAGIFDHSTTGFPLTNGHAAVACNLCHINGNYALTIAPTDCGNSQCHLTTWQQTNNPVHSTSGAAFAAANCSTCHTTAGWTAAAFDHSITGFTLTGTHSSPMPTPCAACHVNNNYTLNSADCYGCHSAVFQGTASIGGSVPNHVTAGFPTTASACATCHPITTWSAGVFDHNATGFPLTNGHAGVACALCHINGNYALAIAPTNCGNSQCHLTTWQQTNNPVHSTSGAAFAAANCSTCHTTVGWDAASFDHSVTGFALTGTHMSPAPTPCASCHVNNNYTLNSTDCYGCHTAAFQSTTTLGGNVPNHVTAGFPTTAAQCASCHPITTWAAGVFNHATTGFPLTNSHATVACNLCHINGNYTLTISPTDCGNSGCHLTTWQQTNNPVHSTAGTAFAAANCNSCHTTVSWTTATFDHSTTGFALVGTHSSPVPTACVACHVNNNYTLNSADCYGCHSAVFQGTATIGGNVPNHVAAGFPTTAAQCASCHPVTTWSAGVFNHASTGFPLTNSHATVACALCHINGNYALNIAPTDCGNSGCHLTTWQQTNAPTHSSAGPTFAAANCNNCHTTVSWTTATFDHSTTGFALTGMHVSPTPTPCASCHVNNNYALNSTACYGCHTAAWQSTATLGGSVPNHITAGFPTDCSICHSTANWTTSTFNHATTTFPLTGAHTSVACAACHVNSNYSGTLPTDCYGCHTAAWQSTTTLGGSVPNHITLGYPTTCASCHTTTSWLGATFNHNATGFPLTGAHVTVACNLCHTTTAPPPTDCYSCHTAQWQSTSTMGGNIPDHTGNGFPPASTCSTCHTTTNWTTATFNHTWWRIPHQGATCATCHQTPGLATNFATFNCTNGCHTPESSWVRDSGRHNAGNYGPMTCTVSGCHPNG
ncbi:MAG: hypothetical protein LAO19_10885 [Acidobacteriia bacterium]|nr:hypothetical protein [Terriglobia bacterium]